MHVRSKWSRVRLFDLFLLRNRNRVEVGPQALITPLSQSLPADQNALDAIIAERSVRDISLTMRILWSSLPFRPQNRYCAFGRRFIPDLCRRVVRR